jgi:Skp family chaperone for outer membrane proteins
MKRILILILILLTVSVAYAQKIRGVGMVDFNYVVTESKAGAAARAESAAFEKSMNDQLLPLRNELVAIQNDFQARESKLKEADKAKIASDFH